MSQGKCPHCGAKITEDAATAERCDLCGGELGRPATKKTAAARAAKASDAPPPKAAEAEAKEGRFPVVWALVAAAVVLGAVPIFCARSKARQTPNDPSSARPIETPAKRAAMARQNNPENDAEFKKFGGADGFDVLGYLPTAVAHARELAADTELVRIEARSVRDTGRADLTVVGSSVAYRFRAPSLSRKPEGKPASFGVRLRCAQVVSVRQRGLNWHATDGSVADCSRQVVRPPTCTLTQVWRRALEAGASPDASGRFTYAAPGEEKDSRFSRRPTRLPGLGGLPTRQPGERGPGQFGRPGMTKEPRESKETKQAETAAADSGAKDSPVAGTWRVEVDSGKTQVFTIDVPDDCTADPAAAPN